MLLGTWFRILVAIALLALFQGSLVLAKVQEDNSHSGIFVSAKGSDFTMEVKGKEHSHTLAGDGKVFDADGKEIKLEDLQKGDRIKVTAKSDDSKTAVKVEVVKKK